jgi:hypothetical protein
MGPIPDHESSQSWDEPQLRGRRRALQQPPVSIYPPDALITRISKLVIVHRDGPP